MKKIIIIFIIFNFICIPYLYSSEASSSSAPTLMMDSCSAEGIGLGNSSVMQYEKSDFMLQNPGIIGSLSGINITLSYIPWVFDTGYYSANIGLNCLGFSVFFFNSKDFDYILKDGTFSSDKLNISELLLMGGFGTKIIKTRDTELSVGASIKYLQSKIYTYSGNGIAGDIGLTGIYKMAKSKNQLMYGLSLQNIGVGQKFVKEKSHLPLKFRVGVGYSFYLLSDLHQLTPLIEYVNDSLNKINTGLEYSYHKILFLRTGYMISSRQDVFSSITGGLGIKYKKYKFDYAVRVLTGNEESLLHSFSLGYGM